MKLKWIEKLNIDGNTDISDFTSCQIGDNIQIYSGSKLPVMQSNIGITTKKYIKTNISLL